VRRAQRQMDCLGGVGQGGEKRWVREDVGEVLLSRGKKRIISGVVCTARHREWGGTIYPGGILGAIGRQDLGWGWAVRQEFAAMYRRGAPREPCLQAAAANVGIVFWKVCLFGLLALGVVQAAYGNTSCSRG